MRWIPLAEVIAEHMKIPGYAEGLEIAQRELDEEIAIYGTIGNPKPTPHFTFVRTPRKTNGFSARSKRVRVTA